MIAPNFRSMASRPGTGRMVGMQRLLNQGGTAGAAPNRTRSSLYQLPTGAVGVRFELANLMTDSAVTYNAAYALSAGTGDWFTPLNSSGEPDNALWVPVTAEGSPNMTVDAAAVKNQPARLLTDAMPFMTPPPSRIDGGRGICLFFRLCSTAGNLTYHDVDATVGLWNGHANAQNPGQFSQTFGGSWGNPANNCIEGGFEVVYQLNDLSPVIVPHSILPIMTMPTLTIMSIGDSILSGASTRGRRDAGINGAGFQLAKALSRPLCPAFHVNEAASGMTTFDFTGNARNTLAIMVPDIILLQTYSANDPDAATVEGVWRAWQRTMALASEAAEAGSQVVLITSPPFCGDGSPRPAAHWEAARVYANELVRKSGMAFVDSDVVIGLERDPVGFAPGTSDDLIHPNEFGSALLALSAAGLLVSRL
jgi:hypothetical protein